MSGLYAPAERWPQATYRPVSYWPDAGGWASAPQGWVLHVVVGNGSPLGTFQGAVSPNRRFSHLWIAKDGSAEQYAPLSSISWAQGAGGNPWGYSVETEGYPSEPLTDAQITTLAAWHRWVGAADTVVDSLPGQGIAWHGLGGAAWGGHYDCPGDIRKAQRAAIISRAQGVDVPITEAEFQRIDQIVKGNFAGIADAVENRYGVRLASGQVLNRDVALADVVDTLHGIVKAGIGAVDVNVLAASLEPLLAAHELSAADVAVELAKRLAA